MRGHLEGGVSVGQLEYECYLAWGHYATTSRGGDVTLEKGSRDDRNQDLLMGEPFFSREMIHNVVFRGSGVK